MHMYVFPVVNMNLFNAINFNDIDTRHENSLPNNSRKLNSNVSQFGNRSRKVNRFDYQTQSKYLLIISYVPMYNRKYGVRKIYTLMETKKSVDYPICWSTNME